jgi:hypothetical protein
MRKLVLAAILAAASLSSGIWVTQAAAYDWRFHPWGTGHFDIIRWSNGDCKIWFDDAAPPVGDWVGLWRLIPTYDRALYRLGQLQALNRCNL